MPRMILRAACAALVLSAAACSSSGGGASAPVVSSPTVAALPTGVTCGHFAAASEASRVKWAGDLMAVLSAEGRVVTDPSAAPGFARNLVELCADSLRSDRVESIAESIAVQAWGS